MWSSGHIADIKTDMSAKCPCRVREQADTASAHGLLRRPLLEHRGQAAGGDAALVDGLAVAVAVHLEQYLDQGAQVIGLVLLEVAGADGDGLERLEHHVGELTGVYVERHEREGRAAARVDYLDGLVGVVAADEALAAE